VSQGREPGPGVVQLDPTMKRIMQLLARRVFTIPVPFSVGLSPILIRPAEARYYLLMENTDSANTLFVGVGIQPVANAVGFTLLPAGSFEPSWTPQEDIWVLGSAANTKGYMIVGNRLAEL
jgi:hypothetical protein